MITTVYATTNLVIVDSKAFPIKTCICLYSKTFDCEYWTAKVLCALTFFRRNSTSKYLPLSQKEQQALKTLTGTISAQSFNGWKTTTNLNWILSLYVLPSVMLLLDLSLSFRKGLYHYIRLCALWLCWLITSSKTSYYKSVCNISYHFKTSFLTWSPTTLSSCIWHEHSHNVTPYKVAYDKSLLCQ